MQQTPGYRYGLFVLCFLGGVLGGVTSTLVPSYLPVMIKDFTTSDEETIKAVINAAFIFGMLPGGLLLGFLSDKRGRKLGIQISMLCIGLFTLLTSFVNDWYWISAFRFATGFGVGGILLTTTIMIAEVWSSKHKDVALGILSISFPVGIFLAGLITYNIANWRTAFLTGIVPLVLMALIQWRITESGSWVQYKKEERVAGKPSFKGSVREIVAGSIIYGAMLIGLWAAFAWLPTWMQNLVHEGDGQKERGTTMMMFAAGGLAGGIISGWFIKYFSMKRTLLLCFGGAFVMCIFLFVYTFDISTFTYIKMFVLALFFGLSQGALNVYIPGLFPVAIRSSATGICFNISRLFTGTAVFFVGWLTNAFGGYGNVLFIFSFVFVAGFFVILFYRERRLI